MATFSREEIMQNFLADFRADGFPPALEARAAEIATRSIMRRCGGHQVYFTKGRDTQSHRDRQIVAAWDGQNQAQLAHRFRLSVRRVEQILAKALKERRAVGRAETVFPSENP